MRAYHPASWSKQARKMADRQWEQFIHYSQPGNDITLVKYDSNYNTIEVPASDIYNYTGFFSSSARNDLIKGRAAKRFGRLAKKAGVTLHFCYTTAKQVEE